MRTRAAVLSELCLPRPYSQSKPLQITDVELDPPGPHEVLVRMRAAGLCHSDLSVINGDRPRPLPMAIGHEGAGLPVDRLLSERIALDDINAAFDRLADGKTVRQIVRL